MKEYLSNESLNKLLILAVATFVLFFVLHLIKKAVSKKILDSDNKYRSRKAINLIGYFILVIIVFTVYRDSIGSFGITLGLASAGIAFALQELIVSIAGWIFIMFSHTIKIGQRVKIGELKGDIIDISVLKTSIMEMGDWIDGDAYNGRITTISNSFVFKEPIQNYSSDYPFLWDEIKVPIRLESDYELARKVFVKVANEVCGDFAKQSQQIWNQMQNKYRIEKAEVNPIISLKFDENWITFTIRYIVDYKRRRVTKDQIYTRLLQEIDQHDQIIMIATNTMEVTSITRKE